MLDVIDTEIWIGLFVLTGILYIARYIQRKNDTRTVYRVSAESLERSKKVMMSVLPLIEDTDGNSIIDIRHLAYPKENVKSAAKILAYYYWKKKQPAELSRVKNAYLSLGRFQDPSRSMDEQARLMTREGRLNEKEFKQYMSHSPFNVKKAKGK